MHKAIKDVMKNRVLLSQTATRMNVFPIPKCQISTGYRVPTAAFGRQRFYTLPRHSAPWQFKIFRLTGDVEHGIVSPPGNRDPTEVPHHIVETGVGVRGGQVTKDRQKGRGKAQPKSEMLLKLELQSNPEAL